MARARCERAALLRHSGPGPGRVSARLLSLMASVGWSGSSRFSLDGKGTLYERALLRHNGPGPGRVDCQVVEPDGKCGMVKVKSLLIDGKGTLEERFCFGILTLDTQEGACFTQQACCFWYLHIPFYDQICTGLCMCQQTSTLIPGSKLNLWKGAIHRSNGAQSPFMLRILRPSHL